MADLDSALNAGVDAGQLIEQLFGYLRDCVAASVGCSNDAFLYTSPSGAEQVATAAKRLGLDALLAAMQILDQTLSRMRYSTQGRILAELALVRISHLEDLDELSAVIAQLQGGLDAGPNPVGPPGPAATGMAKKKLEPAVAVPHSSSAGSGATAGSSGSADSTVGQANRGSQRGDSASDSPLMDSAPASAAPPLALTAENAVEIWNRALMRLSGMVVEHARQFDTVAICPPHRLVVRFKAGYDLCKSACERAEQVTRFQQALAEVTGQRIDVEFALASIEPGDERPSTAPGRGVSPHQRLLEAMRHPLVQRAGELFGAQPVRVDDSRTRE